MAEDWDLFAIVRSCQSATTETPPTSTTTNSIAPISPPDPTSSCFLATFTVQEENDPFSVPNLVQPRSNGFQELHQLLVPFNPTTTTTPTTRGGGGGINPNSPFSDFAGSINGQQRHHHPLVAPPTTTYTSTWPHFVPEASTTSGFNRFLVQQQQKPQQHVQQPQYTQKQHNQLQVVQKQEFQLPQSSSAIVLPNTQSQTPRSRKRKSQQKRMVWHVTADNLSADLWAWRKYGQKPIKGSPYPRNYYRCSSSKGCAARKQVERSTTEPDMFVVTYTGDHIHPRPTHRNSLAGSTRNKPAGTHGSGSPSDPAKRELSSTSAHSPTTPLTAPPENDEAVEDPAVAGEPESPDQELDPNDLDPNDDEILIPNTAAMSDDIFMGLDYFDGGGGNPAGASSGKNPPVLTPVDSQFSSPEPVSN